jgi:hypothetical protein
VYFNPTDESPNGIAKDWTERSVTLDLYFKEKPKTKHEVTQVEDKEGAQYRVQLKGNGLLRSGYHDQLKDAEYPTGYKFSKYSDDKSNIYCPRKGAWLFLDAQFNANLKAIIRSLLPGYSDIQWLVELDNNNHYCTSNRLHADELRLKVVNSTEKGITTSEFLVDYIVTQDNSARFGFEF